MNPQERAVIDGIFERLKNVASQPRDAEVERYIADLIRQQPYAPYAMAQSVYVQEQALLNQQQQIEQLQAEVSQLQQAQAQAQTPPAQQSGGFLSGIFGGSQPRAAAAPTPAYGQRGQQPPAGPWGGQPQAAESPPAGGPWAQQPQQPPQKQGMGFLGTAAAAAAGVAGGMMLGNVLSSAFGGGNAHAGQSGHGLTGLNNGSAGQSASGQSNNQSQSAQGTEPAALEDDYEDDDSDGGYDDGGGDSYDA